MPPADGFFEHGSSRGGGGPRNKTDSAQRAFHEDLTKPLASTKQPCAVLGGEQPCAFTRWRFWKNSGDPEKFERAVLVR